MSLLQLVQISNRYGADEEYVLAGGGNTSYKENDVIYVKGSGTALATIKAEQFVKMDMLKLSAMLTKEYSQEDSTREAEALGDMMAARLLGEENKRPSVEAILHAIFPQKFVCHTHPAIVNGLSCGKDGARDFQSVFGNNAVWVPLTKPGYILAAACRDLFDDYKEQTGKHPQIAILQNHGLFIAADSIDEVDLLTGEVICKLKHRIVERPDFSDVPFDAVATRGIALELQSLYMESGNACAVFCLNKQTREFAKNESTMQELIAPFTPDHIVYCKHTPLFLELGANYSEKFNNYFEAYGFMPKIVAIKELGFFALGSTEKEADMAKMLFLDAMKVAIYSRSFGGVNPLPDDYVSFILNWEAESYRQNALLTDTNC